MTHPKIPTVDFDYVGAFLFEATATDPAVIAGEAEEDFSGYADSPPAISGYRQADIAGMACWNCAHFVPKGDWDDDGDVDGLCELFESKADGECTCDRFTAHADMLRQSPHTSWSEDMADMIRHEDPSMGAGVEQVNYSDLSVLNEIQFATDKATEEDGLIWKEVLRTGRWSHTPTSKGMLKRALQIVRDGQSDPENGIISLAEIYQNFNEKVIPYVTIPLSDDQNDHKNIARVNTGFVRRLKLVDRDGMSVLVAGMDFTEPDVKEKVLRGTIPDVSAGVPFYVTRRADNKTFNTVLDHVCLTRKPFIDKLTPFGLAAADQSEALPVEAWEAEGDDPDPSPSRTQESPPPISSDSLSFRESQDAIRKALVDQLRLGPEYEVWDVRQNSAIVRHSISNAEWEVPLRMTGDSDRPVVMASVDHWKLIEQETPPAPEPEQETESESESEEVAAADSELHRARELRELRLAQPTSNTGGIEMSNLLDGVELSDEARTRIQSVIEDNARLRAQSRESEADRRIAELEGIGLKDRPGALKLYRQVFLSDDGGPAIVLFSDSNDESKKERLTTLEVLDRFLEGLKAGEGSVQFSDQALASGNDNKPPADPSGEQKSLEERVAEQKEALYGKHNRRK